VTEVWLPMMANQALGIAVLSYAGGLNWGFNADWDAIADLHDLVDGLLEWVLGRRGVGAGGRRERRRTRVR